MAVVARRKQNLALAACLSSDAIGNLVYIRDVFSGTRYRVASSDPMSGPKMPAVGVLIDKQTPTAGVIMFYGFTALYSGLAPGEPYVVGTDSRPARLGDPNYPGAGGLIQQIGVATDDDEMLVRPMDVVGEGGAAGNRYYQQSLTTTPDPRVFTVPINFKHGGLDTEVILYNGQRLREGAGHDYVASESGGPGAGYDTITLEFVPRPGSNWFIDFVPDV